MAYDDDLTDDASVVNYDDAVESDNNSWTDSETGISFYFVVFLSLLALVLILSVSSFPSYYNITPFACPPAGRRM
eukprot:scaffold71520_cov50-Attheya_sp.AAC.1